MAAKSIRKSVSFDQGDGDRALLDAIATHQAKHQQSFSELCKQALTHYLLGQEPTQSVLLFMELQQQISQLRVRVEALEDEASMALAFNQPKEPQIAHPDPQSETQATPPLENTTDEVNEPMEDPVLSRLGPLLDDF